MPPRPTAPHLLPDLLGDLLADRRGDRPLRVAVDGAGPTHPDRVAGSLVDPLRIRGRRAVLVDSGWFLRPASLRLERGRTDPDAFFDDWLDAGALRREVLDAADQPTDARVLPTMRDPQTDRATRADYVDVGSDTVVLVSGSLLLGRALPFDVTVHLRLSAAALRRRTPADEQWTLPAFERYEAEVGPADRADVVLLVDDPARPAVLLR